MMPTATNAKPTAAAGGGRSSTIPAEILSEVRHNPTLLWHIRGEVELPTDLQGEKFKAGTRHPAYVCCRCGEVEVTAYALKINHGCCDNYRPMCAAVERRNGWAKHWRPLPAGVLAMGQLGGLDVGDVVALPGQPRPMLVTAIDVPPRAPHMAVLSDRWGNRIEIDGRSVHTLDLLARGRRYPHFPSNSRGVHVFMPLVGNIGECYQCGGGNHPYHAEAPNGPGRFVPVVEAPGVQPVPGPGSHEGFRKLVSEGKLIDMAGYPLTFVNCLCDRGKVSGMTCPIDVPCTTCGAKKGKRCVRPSEHEAADFHAARQKAADDDMARREAEGDPDVPAPWPGVTTKREAATVTAAVKNPTKKKAPPAKPAPVDPAAAGVRWVTYKGADAVPGNDLKPGEEIRCPVSGCDRRAKIRRDGKISSHKMFGSQTCKGYAVKIPDHVMVDVLSRRSAAAAKAASAQQIELDGMADLFGAMLAGQESTAAAAAAVKPETTPLPQVYNAELMVAPPGREKRQPGGARQVRVDELAKLREEDAERCRAYNALPADERKHNFEPTWRSWCIASEGEGIPPRHVSSLTKLDGPGQRAQDGTTMWRLNTLLDGERGHTTGDYDVWGSTVVTIVPPGTGGWGPGMFRVNERAEVQLKHDGPWLRVRKITYSGVYVRKQDKIVAWSDIFAYRKWGNEVHLHPGEVSLVHGTHQPEEHFGFDGGEHRFVPMFTGSLRCKVCLDSIRWKGHHGILNADFQGFEEIRQRMLRPGNTWQGRVHDTELLDRYVRGLPLVRYDRDRDIMWNLVCPVGNLRSVDAPKCGGMHINFATRRAAKAWWFKHCAEHHGGAKKHDSWGREWKPTWDDAEFPEEPGIVFDPKPFAKHIGTEKPVAVKVLVPRSDPSWERLIEQFRTEGRHLVEQPPTDRNRNAYVTIQFDEGQPAAAKLRAALKSAGFSSSDIEVVKGLPVFKRDSLAEMLGHTFDPKLVDRTTGSIRDPEKMVFTLDEADVRQLLALEKAAADETAIIRGVIVHCGSGNAVPVGWFAGTREAKEWWNADFNRMRSDKDVEFVLLAPDSWENDYDREALAEPKPEPVKVEVATLPGLDDFMAAMGGTAAAPAASELDEALAALSGIATAVVVPALPAATVRPATPAYVTLPEGWTGPERCPLPDDMIVVLARQLYWNSDLRDKPDHTLHIVNWGLPENGFCRTTLVHTEDRKPGFTPDMARPVDLNGREDARYGTPAEATCTKCQWAVKNQTSRDALPHQILDPLKRARRQERDDRRAAKAGPGPDASDGERMLLTDVPLHSYIEVPGRDGFKTRRGYLIEAPRVHTAGWGDRQEGREKDRPYLKYLLGEGGTTVGMYSPVYLKVTVLPTPDAAPVLPEPHATRPICVQDLRPGDVVDRGGLKQKTRDGVVTVIGRPMLVSLDEVRIRIRVGGQETSARVDRWSWTQLVEAAPFAKGDDMPLAVESKLEDRDLRALHLECKEILGRYNLPYGEAPSQQLLLWAAGAMHLRSGYFLWKSWHSGDQMATYLPKGKSAQGVGGGAWFECDKGGFTLYPSCPKDKAEAQKMREKLRVTEQSWDQVLPFFTKVPARVRQLIEDLMADREANSPGLGYTAEHISPAPRDAESLSERTYRMGIEHDLFKAAMEAWVSVRPA
jgi:hypothetical protein